MEFQLFRRFTNPEELDGISKALHTKDIAHSVKSPTTSPLGSSYGSSNQEFYELYVRKADFEIVKALLQERAEVIVKNLDSDYHLFSYSDTELKSLLSEPDEWNEIDVVLSAKILREREEAIKSGKLNTGFKTNVDKTEQEKTYPHYDHKKHFVRSYIKYFTFLMVTVSLALALGLFKYIINPADIQNSSTTDTLIFLGLVIINMLYYQEQFTCPNCREKLRTTLIHTLRAGDIAIPKPFNVIKKIRCENCGHLWNEFIDESD